MNEHEANDKITVTCPSGHRLRGGSLLVGKRVCCPRCHRQFTFAVTPPTRIENRAITDTGVMRILGEMPKPPEPMPGESMPGESAEKENRAVSDTGVMRILDEASGTTASHKPSVPLRACSRCGVQIPENLAVCNHCNCYVGLLPTFLQEMTGSGNIEGQHN